MPKINIDDLRESIQDTMKNLKNDFLQLDMYLKNGMSLSEYEDIKLCIKCKSTYLLENLEKLFYESLKKDMEQIENDLANKKEW